MIVEKISDFILETNYENISKKDIELIKLCFLDYLAVTIKGINQTPTKYLIKTLNELNYPFSNSKQFQDSCKVIGYDNSYFNTLNAGFINGVSAHVLELDDGHRLAQLHPGAVVFSTALAVSQSTDSSSKEFLGSVIIGYEISITLGKLVNPNHRNQGFHSTGTIGAIAAGATASKLLKLNKFQIISALGLSGTQSSGLLESDHQGSMGKVLHVGKAVTNGILAAYLAKNGFTGTESIIDGDEGFIRAMSTKTVINHDLLNDYINENLKKSHINEVYHKKYPFCRHIHSTIDSIFKLKNQLNHDKININQIDKVIVNTYKIAAEHNNYNPLNKQDLKQSLPFAVAIALIYGNVNIDLIDSLIKKDLLTPNESENLEEINNIKNLLNKIIIINNENLTNLFPEKRPANVKIVVNTKLNNKIFEDETYFPLGEAENPLTKMDILKKFKILNPNYDMEKLKIIENMEDYKLNELLKII
ncbi:MmgE/PrpD family protein [Methanobrevibacter acididurans]|uniref:MmgE/PrpD family protein n=1 Tax=Methanobrevibacter acididurans TaxID=120963 RepID=UPI0038FCAA20